MYAKNLIGTISDLEKPMPPALRVMAKKQARMMFDSFMVIMDQLDESVYNVEQFIQQYQNPSEKVVREDLGRCIPPASFALDTLIALGKIRFATNSLGERTVSLVAPVEQNRYITFALEDGKPYAAIA